MCLDKSVEEEKFDFCPKCVILVFTFVTMGLILVAIIMSILAVGTQELLSVTPTVFDATAASELKTAFKAGFLQICPEGGECMDQLMSSDGDQGVYSLIVYRIAAFGCNLAGMVSSVIALLGVIVIVVFWFKTKGENVAMRRLRTAVCIILLVTSLLFQSSLLFFHMQLQVEKWIASSKVPYSFNTWSPAQWTTTDISFGVSYYSLLMTNVFALPSAWMLIASLCFWMEPKKVFEQSQVNFAIPRPGLLPKI